MSYQILRSESLRNIPQRKIHEMYEDIVRNCAECSIKKDVKIDKNVCVKCSLLNKMYRKYSECNIPLRYWPLEMNSFKGDLMLKEKYDELNKDITQTYKDGTSLCFAGSFGVGKTYLLCCILKRAAEKGYNCLYTKLGDIVSALLDHSSDGNARKELMMSDFLVIDEFDPRYMATEKAADLYGKMLEEIYRTRHENKLPTFMATNSPNVVESFSGSVKQSIQSLMSTVTEVQVLGQDHRKLNGANNVRV